MVFDYEKCIKYKETYIGDIKFNYIWRNCFAPSNKIGNCTNLYRRLNPSSYEDFYKKYVEYAEANKDLKIKDRGLTYDELVLLSKNYKDKCKNTGCEVYDDEVYFYVALAHIIIETFDGQEKERMFKEYLIKNGFSCDCLDGVFDGKYGIDIIAKDAKNNKFFIQIKPLSFFASSRMDVVQDQKKLCEKYKDLYLNHNIQTLYAVYVINPDNSIEWFKNNGTKYSFKLNDLFEVDEHLNFCKVKKFWKTKDKGKLI